MEGVILETNTLFIDNKNKMTITMVENKIHKPQKIADKNSKNQRKKKEKQELKKLYNLINKIKLL